MNYCLWRAARYGLAVVLLVSYLAYVMFAVFRVRNGRPRHRIAALGPAIALAQQDTQALFDPEREQAEERITQGRGGRGGAPVASTGATGARAPPGRRRRT